MVHDGRIVPVLAPSLARRLRLTLGGLLLLALVLPTGAARAAETEVEVIDDAFVPSVVTIDAGDQVSWLFRGSREHTVTFDNGPGSGAQFSGAIFRRAFPEPGRYAYFCDFHGGPGGTGMAGVVIVLVPDPATSTTTTTTRVTTTSTSTPSTAAPTTRPPTSATTRPPTSATTRPPTTAAAPTSAAPAVGATTTRPPTTAPPATAPGSPAPTTPPVGGTPTTAFPPPSEFAFVATTAPSGSTNSSSTTPDQAAPAGPGGRVTINEEEPGRNLAPLLIFGGAVAAVGIGMLILRRRPL